MTLYLDNPRSAKRRRKRKKGRTKAQRRAIKRLVALNRARRKARKGHARKRRAKRRTAHKGHTRKRRVHPMARKRTRRRRAGARRIRRNDPGRPRHRRRGRSRRHRRNPPFTLRGIGQKLMDRGVGAVAVTVGKGGARLLANVLPLPKEGAMNIVTQLVAGIVTGVVADFLPIPHQFARDIGVGGLQAPIETVAKGIPLIGPALGDDDLVLGEYGFDIGAIEEDVGSYEELPPGVGDMGDVGAYEYQYQ